MSQQETVADLVAAAIAGDEFAFTQLVRRHEDFAYGVAIGLLGDFDLARDVVQEAFVCVHRDLVKLKQQERFSGWLRTIVRHTAFRALRELERVRRLAGEVARESGSAPPVPGPDEDLGRRERRALVMAALNRLSDVNREVMSLFYVHDLPYAQIAAFLDVPESTVLGRLQRGRAQLRKEIDMVEKTFEEEGLPDDFAEQIQRLLELGAEDKVGEKTSLDKLGILGSEAVEPLCRALDDPRDTVRLVAARALCRIGDARALNPILRQLYGYQTWQAENWKRSLARGGGLLDIPGVRDELLRLLDDPVRHKECWIYDALAAAKGDEQVFERVMVALCMPLTEGYHQYRAVCAACEINPEGKTEIIVRALQSDSLRARWSALWHAGREGMLIPIEDCVQALHDELGWWGCGWAGELLHLHGEEGRRAVVSLLTSERRHERLTGAMALADTDDEQAFQVLKECLLDLDLDKQWRRAVSRIIGHHFGGRFLSWAENDPEIAMANRNVAWTLARLDEVVESRLVERMFAEGTPVVQVAAMRYLLRLRGIGFVTELRQCVREGKPSKVATEALHQLMKLGEAIEPELEDMLEADDWAERRAAVAALSVSGRLTQLQLKTAAGDPHVAVRNAAAKAMG